MTTETDALAPLYRSWLNSAMPKRQGPELGKVQSSTCSDQEYTCAVKLLEQREVFIFDEPTSGLDYEGLLQVVARLKQLVSTGAVMILITHDEELLALCADYQIVIPPANLA